MSRMHIRKSGSVVLPLTSERTDIIVHREVEVDFFIPLHVRRSGRFSFRVYLRGEGAQARVYGAGVIRGATELSLTVDTIHEAPNTNGSTLVKAVVQDAGRFEFFGMIKILEGAQKSNDFLQQDSLLLSEGASANAVPGLEIEANDVKASHAATAAPMNFEQLFYLRSRGIPEMAATQLVAEAFLSPAMKTIDEKLRNSLLRPLRV